MGEWEEGGGEKDEEGGEGRGGEKDEEGGEGRGGRKMKREGRGEGEAPFLRVYVYTSLASF